MNGLARRKACTSRYKPYSENRNKRGQPAAISAKQLDQGFPISVMPGSSGPLTKDCGEQPVTPFISVIDDDLFVCMASTALARSLGHAVHSFASAQAFLELAYVDSTSCLIVDVQMPR